MACPPVIFSEQALQHGTLPITQLAIQHRSGLWMAGDQISLLRGVGVEVEELVRRLALRGLMDDQLEATVDNRPRAEVVGLRDGSLMTVKNGFCSWRALPMN